MAHEFTELEREEQPDDYRDCSDSHSGNYKIAYELFNEMHYHPSNGNCYDLETSTVYIGNGEVYNVYRSLKADRNSNYNDKSPVTLASNLRPRRVER